MKHLKQNWKYYISPTLLLCLILVGLWFWRGVGFATVAKDLDPHTVNVYVACLDEEGKHVSAHYDVDAGSPEGQEILDTLYALTIHRPPTNLLYQILKPTLPSQQFLEEDYAFVVRVFGETGGHAALQFHIKTWSYDTVAQSRYLPCSVEGGQETGRAFGRQLWALAPKVDNN